MGENWDNKIEYLKLTRDYFWNDDYLEFLIKHVWKINTPIKVLDFGCGYGYLGMKLLPLLPQGSTYTGIDIGKELLQTAKREFQNSSFEADFIETDLLDYVPLPKYDLAICQSVLRHIPQYKVILGKMIDSVAVGGRVVCLEINRRMENAGLYISDLECDINKHDEWLAKKWQEEIMNGGRDYLAGAKIPMYMEELGLKDVSVRVNDFAEYISPTHDKENYDKHIKSFLTEHGFNDTEITGNIKALNIRSMIITSGIKSS